MTLIEKGPPLISHASTGKTCASNSSSSGASKGDPTRTSKSPETKDKGVKRDSDLISTATSALRRLHFRSAGGSRSKRGQTTSSAGQGVPKLNVMGSSTTSETTTNTSTDSSNTVYTMVTVTDAEQDEKVDEELLDTKMEVLGEKLRLKESSDSKNDVRRRFESRYDKYETRRNNEILNEFDELFLEHEKRIRAEEEKHARKARMGFPRHRLERKAMEQNRKGEIKEYGRLEDFRVTTVTIEDIQDRRRNTLRQQNKSSESEEALVKTTASSSSERESDEIYSSIEEPLLGTGAPPPTPLIPVTQKEQSVCRKSGVIDEETVRNLESIIENGTPKSEKKEKPHKDRLRSNVRTIQGELPQLTLRSDFYKKPRKGDQKESGNKRNHTDREKVSPGECTEIFYPFPHRSGSPKPLSRSASPKFSRSSSSNFKKLSEKSPAIDEEPRTGEVAALTTSNLEKHDKQISEEMKKHKHSRYERIFNMDSPTTLKSSPPVDGFFDPTKSSGKFEFPSCISPTEITSAFTGGIPAGDLDSPRGIPGEQSKSVKGEQLEAPENANKKRKRSDRKSIGEESRSKLLDVEKKIAQAKKCEESSYRDIILEDKPASFQSRKYSVLTTDGNVKNFVSENSEDFIKTTEGGNKENKKSSGTRRGSECPQRHRRVSIIQGDSLRHFIFEEPEPTRKSSRRKMSAMPEDTTKTLLLEDAFARKSSLVPGDTLRNLLGDEGTRNSSNPEEKPRKFSINTLGDIVSARKFSLLPPGEIYTSQIDGKTTEIIKLAPGTKGRPLATIVVQQASIQRGSISGPSGQKEDALLDVANTFTLEELHEFDMKYGSPHHCRSQSVKTPGRSCGRPNYLCLPQQRSRVASMPNTGVEEEYYRLRHFSITGKGVVNRGDSLKSRRSRSNNSVASSNSSHSTEHLPSNMGTVGSHPGSARTSAECSLASSRESSTTSMPFKVVMLGGAGVGKSSLISQFMTSEYLHAYDTSLDEEYGEKSVSVLLDGEESELIFVDHPSSEMSPENCITTYEPQAYIVVYSVVDRSSLEIAEEILQSLWKTESIASKAVILVANKTDLVRSRTVTTEEGKSMACSYDCKFIETSVGINHNVDELLVGILTQIRLKIQQAMKPKRNRSPLGSCMGKDKESPKKWRNTRLTASLKVKGLLGRVWARDSKSKSFSGESLTTEEVEQLENYSKFWFQSEP